MYSTKSQNSSLELQVHPDALILFQLAVYFKHTKEEGRNIGGKIRLLSDVMFLPVSVSRWATLKMVPRLQL